MKAHFFKNLTRLVSAAAILVFASCANILSNSDDSKSSSSGEKIAVTFDFSTPSRSAMPSVDLSGYKYKIQYKLHADSDYTTSSAFTGNASISLSLEAGTYDFVVNAYASSDTSFATPILKGSATEQAISASSHAVSVVLKAAEGSTGSVEITLKVANSLSVSTIKAGLYDSITATDSGAALEIDTTTNSDYQTVTYSNLTVASGVSKYVIFFLYDSLNNLVMTYVDSVYVVAGLTSSDTHTINTATFAATVTVQKNGKSWGDSGLEITLVNSTDSNSPITMEASGADYTANVDKEKTYAVYVGGEDTGKSVSLAASIPTLNYLVPTLYPAQGEKNAFADTQLILTFESEPTLVADSKVTISSGSTEVDSISVNSTTEDGKQSAQSGYTVNVGNKQLVRVDGNSVYIQPHYNGSASATKLSYGTEYTVDVSGIVSLDSSTYDGMLFPDGTSTWSFKTKTEPATLNTTISVSNATSSNTADYFSVYGAMFAAAAKSSGTYEIQIAKTGTPYYELISIQGKGAHIILKGQGSANYGSDVVIEYVNNQHMNNSSHTRPSFYFKGSGNLTFENVTLKNLTERKVSYTKDGFYGGNTSASGTSNNYQAEALYYACSSGFVNAYNSSFISLQDTILTAGDKAWFYGCYIAGDVDFMWGTSNVALFENCAIKCLNTSTDTAYLFETRVGSTSGTMIGKGYVLYNSTVTVDSGVRAYYARRATNKTTGNNGGATTYYDQVAIVDTTFTGSGSLDAARWYVGNEPEYLSSSLYGTNADVGWKEYGVTNNTATNATASTSAYGTITSEEYANEYSGRGAILNRYYDITEKKYAKDTTTNFNVKTLISTRGYKCTTDSSKETLSGEAEVITTTWDFSSSDFGSGTTSYNGIALSGTSYDSKGYCVGGSNSTISIPATGACSVTVYYCYAANGTISATGDTTDETVSFSTISKSTSTIETATFNYTLTTAGTIVVATSETTYITKITQSYTSDGTSTDPEETAEAKTYNFVGLTFSDFPANSLFSKTDSTYTATTTLIDTAYIGVGTWTIADASVYCKSDGNIFAGASSSSSKYLQYNGESANFAGTVSSVTISSLTRYISIPISEAGTVTVTYDVGKSDSASGDIGVLALLDANGEVLSIKTGLAVKTGSTDQTATATVTATTGTMYVAFSRNGAGGGSLRVKKIEYTPSASSTGVTAVSIDGNSSVTVGKSITLTANVTGTPKTASYKWTITDGTDYASFTSTAGTTTTTTTASTVTLYGIEAGSAKVTVTVDSETSDAKSVTVNAATAVTKVIKKSDVPEGFAGVDADSYFGKYTGWTTVTASNRADFEKYAESSSAYIILVDTMIDLSDGMLPATYDGTTSKLDSFIATTTSNAYTSYDDWRTKYAAQCKKNTDEEKSGYTSGLLSTQSALTTAYKKIVQIDFQSNKMVIGTTEGAGVKGGSLMLNGVDNIAIRNMIIQDAYDPFPHHENKSSNTASDGYNAQYDCITVQGTCNYIWIDHCLIQDTLTDHVYVITDATTDTNTSGWNTYEKWQTYDGLCDMKGDSHNITVSNCIFKSHDKTMLIGPDDKAETFSSGKGLRTITLINNYFQDCVQRLPMVRNTKIHVVNNYYNFTKYTATKKTGSTTEQEEISSSYAIGVRYGSKVYSQANYFDSGIQYSYSGEEDSKNGYIKIVDDTDKSSKKQNTSKLASSRVVTTFGTGDEEFEPSSITGYSVTLKSGDDVKTYVLENAGAGYTWSAD